tara:strand:- start:1717 stop:2460 length:744 start_codon:yes stop_codon:yes gene_type:complete
MKFNNILIVLLLATFSCSPNYTKLDNRVPYNAKGFALIYNKSDFENKSLKNSINGSQIKVFHKSLKSNTLIKLINPKNNLYLIVKNDKKFDYPDFYKIIITDAVAKKLEIDLSLPLIEIIEIKKNKSFIAKKAKIYKEEEKIPSKAPVTSVKISNISKDKNIIKNKSKSKIFIEIATFYSKETAEFLKNRIIKEIPNYDAKKLKIRKKSNKEIKVISGPYKAINLVKNDYSLLKKFGFEELDITINE